MQVLPPLNVVPSGHNSVLAQTPKETAGNSRVTAKLLAELGGQPAADKAGRSAKA